ncbi:MAG: sugar phosphate isomerase/epimerase [Thermoprotei archaeon]|nr:sugar phosphate isomerase/epimerase [Thermoprotei archaeon]
MKLGLVTYNLAKNWDLKTIMKYCSEAKFEAVELRTGHAHGVEPTLSKEERRRVRELFESFTVKLLSFGTTCEYHSPDPNEVRRNIDLTKRFIELAADTGALGVKVRPNRLMEDYGIPREKTIRQIGIALRECGEYADDHGVEVWLEVHGKGTCDLNVIKSIMEVTDHDSVGVCWNSNPTDVIRGSIKETFSLVKRWIKSVHIHELYDESYPYRELFSLLKAMGYKRYCLAEIPESKEPLRLMKYYRALWLELTR